MKLRDYIELIGDEAASKLFSTPERTVASWRRCERYPGRPKARLIEKKTKGKVKFAECYE